jgi:hypothetical protein
VAEGITDRDVPPFALAVLDAGESYRHLATEMRPQLFDAAAIASPALWTSSEEQRAAVPDAFDDARDFERHDVFARTEQLRGLALRVDCGADDPFREAAEEFRARVRPEPAGGMEDRCHDGDYWRRIAPKQVDFIGGALAA